MKKRTAPARKATKATPSSTPQPKGERPFAPGYGLATDREGLLSWDWVAKQMTACRTFWINTVRPDSRPHSMPVWAVWVDDAICFSTGRKSRKGRNLAANPACTITNDDGEKAVIVEGVAEEVTDSPSLESIAATYKKKYKMDPRSMGEPIFRVKARTVFAFIEETFPKSATRWKF